MRRNLASACFIALVSACSAPESRLADRDVGAGGARTIGDVPDDADACTSLRRSDCLACCAELPAHLDGDALAACACGPTCAKPCAAACAGGPPSLECVGCVADTASKLACSPPDVCANACPEPGDVASGGPASAASSAASSGASSGSGSPSSDAAQACVDRVNQYRATLGLAPYARWTREEGCADGQAESDSQSGEAHGAFTACGEWAQNECPGWPGDPVEMIGDCLEAMWGEGPGGGHYENMSSRDYTSIACGFHVTPSGDVWAVQDFK